MSANNLVEYVTEHTFRGECQCGACCDKGNRPGPTGHTADMIFFQVAANGTVSADEFRRFTAKFCSEYHFSEYRHLNPLDGLTHGYIELGGWIGDQGTALRYMGLGVLLGVFDLKTPLTVLGLDKEDPVSMRLVGSGFIAVIACPQSAIAPAASGGSPDAGEELGRSRG